MKRIIGLLIFMGGTITHAQTYSIIQSTASHDGQSRTALETDIAPKPNDTRKAFQAYLKKEYNLKLKRNGNFYAVMGATINTISNDQIDLYSSFNENKEGGTEMIIFARKGYDIYIDNKNESIAFEGMRKVFQKFLNGYLGTYYEKQLSIAVGASKDLLKEKKKMLQKNEQLKKDIENNKKDIEKMTEENSKSKQEIKDNIEALKNLKEKIAESDKKVDLIKTKKQKIN